MKTGRDREMLVYTKKVLETKKRTYSNRTTSYLMDLVIVNTCSF